VTVAEGHSHSGRPPLALALSLLSSARVHAARHSTPFSMCIVANGGDVVMLAREQGARADLATAAARAALSGPSTHGDEFAGAVLPEVASLSGSVEGAIGIAARDTIAHRILDGTLVDLDRHIARSLGQ
jgi:uncharacterized protein GlcG (DUF336 family)